MDELVVAEVVRRRVEAALSRVINHELLYETWNLRSLDPRRAGVALNFYGPPGTGKSLCAEAVAHRLGRAALFVNYAEIESRYVGETPKNIVRAFEAARAQDAVLVFDEADSILGSRLSSVTQSADHGVNVSRAVMLSQLDRFAGLAIFTTNFPRNYDAAFVRRILAHVEFDLPDQPTRTRLWGSLMPRELPLTDDVDLDALAAASDGLGGGDLVNVIIGAAVHAVARPAADRRVLMDDLLAEIRLVKDAHRDVGHGPEPARVVSVTRNARLPEGIPLPAPG